MVLMIYTKYSKVLSTSTYEILTSMGKSLTQAGRNCSYLRGIASGYMFMAGEYVRRLTGDHWLETIGWRPLAGDYWLETTGWRPLATW